MPLPKVSAIFAALFRSKFEAQVFQQMTDAGVPLDYKQNYEAIRFKVAIPARVASYTPDLVWPDRKVAIELKGRFTDASVRQKLLLFIEQNPEWDVRLLLQRAKVPLYKGSKTSQEDWARSHNITFAIGEMPPEWITELSAQGTP